MAITRVGFDEHMSTKKEVAVYYRCQIEQKLKAPLKTLAAGKGLQVRELASQVLSDFVSRRQALLADIAKNNNETESKGQTST